MINISFNYEKISLLGNLLRKFGINNIYLIEGIDPQYLAIKKLTELLDKLYIPILVLMNALISYKLNCKGEVYWNEFSSLVINFINKNNLRILNTEQLSNLFKYVLNNSTCNIYLKEQKYNRIQKLLKSMLIKDLINNIHIYSGDLKRLWNDLSKYMSSPPDSKTTVFAIKMFYYGWRASFNQILKIPTEIPIPVDRRITYMTLKSNLISTNITILTNDIINKFMIKYKQYIIRVWNMVSKLSGIPPLNLDSIVWPISTQDNIENILKVLDYENKQIFSRILNLLIR